MTGGDDGGNGGDGEDEVRHVRHIPGPRTPADDLDLDGTPRPVIRSDLADLTALPTARDAGDEAATGTEGAGTGPCEDGDTVADTHADGDADGAGSAPSRAEDARTAKGPARVPAQGAGPKLTHTVLKSLLGAWALSACSAEESAAVEAHLDGCHGCAEEGRRLRDAVGLLHTDRSLDLDPMLRSRVIEGCLERRPARIPVPEWAAPYDAETARLDALLRDIGPSEWHAPVRLRWFQDERQVSRKTTVAGVISHLMAVDGLVAVALDLDDPLGPDGRELSPVARTEALWSAGRRPPTRAVREPWREQNHALIRTVSFAGRGVENQSVSYGDLALPMRDSLLDRAFECWVHGWDIAEAVDYPYAQPSSGHLHRMIDLAVRQVPGALANRRRAGLASPAKQLVAAGSPGRSLHLEVEGWGGGDWYIPLDSPAALGSRDHVEAHIAVDAAEFCQLLAGHVPPAEAAAGHVGEREAIADVLFALASLSRM
ncbi:maleylpyruvate isomerase N-terminal domain-containing protein [uncultured Streptomyces sp.]|uniref:maleylpyruvate isomerase N-terminal domain-containing protein n=1 Tax=uncultured Streptomyces sp. TaxID=174707 RepID=UPI00260DCC9A|nr:maleylpyruvate isomerase N-terminal domain-containing protein [uncultured Streptomyces sp.]